MFGGEREREVGEEDRSTHVHVSYKKMRETMRIDNATLLMSSHDKLLAPWRRAPHPFNHIVIQSSVGMWQNRCCN